MGGAASSQKKADDKYKKHLNEGDTIPSVTIKARIRVAPGEDIKAFQWRDINTDDLFKGKRIVLFSIPGGKHQTGDASFGMLLTWLMIYSFHTSLLLRSLTWL